MKFLDLYYLVQCESFFYTDQDFCNKIIEIYNAYIQDLKTSKTAQETKHIENLKNYLSSLTEKKQETFSKKLSHFLANPAPANINDAEIISEHSVSFKEVPLPSLVPTQVAISDLKKNGRIATDKDFETAKNQFAQDSTLKQLVINKIQFICLDQQCYAVYPKKLDSGSFGEIYLIQNHIGEWEILKTLNIADTTINPKAPSRNRRKEANIAAVAENDVNNEADSLKQQEKYLGHFIDGKKAYLGIKRAYGVTLEHFHSSDVFALRWLRHIKAILLAAKNHYDQGYLHRDLRPSNIIINPATGKVILIDFGLNVKYDPATGNHEESNYSKAGHPAFIGQHNRDIITSNSTNADKRPLLFNQQTELNTLAVTIGHWLKLAIANMASPTFYDPAKDKGKIEQSPLPKILTPFVIELLKQMDSASPENRVTYTDILTKIEKMEENLLEVTNNFREFGIVNLEEIIDRGGKINEFFLTPLRLFDKVYLLYPKKTMVDGNNVHVGSIIEELTKQHGIKIAGLFEVPAITTEIFPNLMADIKNHIANTENNTINGYHFLSTESELVAMKQPSVNTILVTSEKFAKDYKKESEIIHSPNGDSEQAAQINHYNIVIKGLQTEFDKVVNKHLLAVKNKDTKQATQSFLCADAIEQTMKKLQDEHKAGNLTNHILRKHLLDLESQILKINTSNFKYYMAKWFGFGAIGNTAKSINKISEAIPKQTNTIHIRKPK